MRILCLHGHGTSAAIFTSQTVAFRSKLDESYEFDFIDAPFPSAPAPGVELLWESGNFTWWPETTVQSIRAAHRRIDDYIDRNGPYDAVCCFSQGCSLIGSYLLYHAKESPNRPLPFKAAIFICGGVPLAVLEDLGLPVPQRAKDLNDKTSKSLQTRTHLLRELASDPRKIMPGVGLWDDTSDLLHDPSRMPPPSDVFGLDFTSFPTKIRIQIPTVHIYGCKDPRWPASMQLAHFCDNRTMYDHGGGHDIPRSTEVSVKIADLVATVTRAS